RTLVSFSNVVAFPLVAGVTGIYLCSNQHHFPTGWAWLVAGSSHWLARTLLGGALVFGIEGAMTYFALRRARSPWRNWLLVALVLLTLVPFYWMGIANEL